MSEPVIFLMNAVFLNQCAANLFVLTFTIILGENKAFGCKKVVFLGIFQKILGISAPHIF